MIKTVFLAFLATLAAVPALAQVAPVPAPSPVGRYGQGQTANGGYGAVEIYTPTGRAQDQIATDSAEAGNANLPSRPVPNTGGGGDSGGGN